MPDKVYEDINNSGLITYYKKYRSSSSPGYYSSVYDQEVKKRYGDLSPRINGKLVPRQNRYWMHHRWVKPSIVTTKRKWSRDFGGGTDILQSVLSSPTHHEFSIDLFNSTKYHAARKFHNRINDIDFNAAQFIAERRQTYNLIASNVTRLANMYRSLRRGRNPFRNGSRSRSKDAANIWLEYSYGWVPLVSDVYALMELQKMEPPPFHLSRYEKGTDKGTISSKISFEGFVATQYRSFDTTFRVTYYGKVQVNNHELAFINNLGLTNPALLAWELLPYSFVVDWFIPIGDWLKYQATPKAVTVSDQSVTTTFSTKHHVSVGDGSRATGDVYLTTFEGNYADSYVYSKSRELQAVPHPPLSINMPDNWRNGLSALALLRQAFS